MLTIPGAAMTAPWYVQRCKGGVAAANAGNMREIIRLVAGPGKSKADLRAIRATIHGDRQVDDFVAFRKLLGT